MMWDTTMHGPSIYFILFLSYFKLFDTSYRNPSLYSCHFCNLQIFYILCILQAWDIRKSRL